MPVLSLTEMIWPLIYMLVATGSVQPLKTTTIRPAVRAFRWETVMEFVPLLFLYPEPYKTLASAATVLAPVIGTMAA